MDEDPLLFGWHEAKSQACFDGRGFDFGYASRIFDGPMFEKVDDRADYGELRIQARGLIDGKPYCVVFSRRDEVIWIITAFRIHWSEWQRVST